MRCRQLISRPYAFAAVLVCRGDMRWWLKGEGGMEPPEIWRCCAEPTAGVRAEACCRADSGCCAAKRGEGSSKGLRGEARSAAIGVAARRRARSLRRCNRKEVA